MKLIKELFHPGQFTLLTAPVAAGKTRLITEFYRSENYKMIFVSPLRALASEVYQKLSQHERHVYLLGKSLDGKNSDSAVAMTNFLQASKGFLVTTMELLSEEFLEACSDQKEKIIFVLDEFHLFYHWGESFRPILHDRFLAILNIEAPLLAITATMGEELLTRLRSDLAYYCEQWFHLDFGNHQLHRPPTRIHYFSASDKALFSRTLWRELREKNSCDVYLVFCAYRSEVDDFLERAQRLGIKSLGCVGGEVAAFLENLNAINGEAECIFSTTTLSHGVNLPEISKVFITYEVANYDFWLQMIGRGGRRGGNYEVYTFDAFHSDKISKLKQRWRSYLADFISI